ncbi:MAG: metallophosphoesterase [Paludibacteraceae bacterium]|nr:metallophosphoesterase [Paludibacteraceae bacterium]
MQVYGIVVFLILFLVIAPDTYLYFRFMRNSVSRSVCALHWIICAFFSLFTTFILMNVNNIYSPETICELMTFVATLGAIYFPKLIFSNFDLLYRLTKRRWKRLHYWGYILGAVSFVMIMYAIHFGKFNFGKGEYTVELENLPDAFDGYKIVQVSDFHLGSFSNAMMRVKPLFDMLKEENADLVVFTGDMVNTFPEETLGWDSLFLSIPSKDTKLGIMGNHDYAPYFRWKSPEERAANIRGIEASIERLGFKLLKNETHIIRRGSDSLAISGVEYSNGRKKSFVPSFSNLAKCDENVSDSAIRILLLHDPTIYDDSIVGKRNYALTLSGHTHSAQIGIIIGNFKWSPSHIRFKYCDGQYFVGKQCIITSRGVGCVGIPARLGMNPEYEVITLKKKRQ